MKMFRIMAVAILGVGLSVQANGPMGTPAVEVTKQAVKAVVNNSQLASVMTALGITLGCGAAWRLWPIVKSYLNNRTAEKIESGIEELQGEDSKCTKAKACEKQTCSHVFVRKKTIQSLNNDIDDLDRRYADNDPHRPIALDTLHDKWERNVSKLEDKIKDKSYDKHLEEQKTIAEAVKKSTQTVHDKAKKDNLGWGSVLGALSMLSLGVACWMW